MEHEPHKIGKALKFELIFICKSLLSQAKLLVLSFLSSVSSNSKNTTKSILFVQTANLGDAVILIPVIKALQREHYHVEVISSSYTKPLFEYFNVNVIASFDDARYSKRHFIPLRKQDIADLHHYDRVIFVRGSIYLMYLLAKRKTGKLIIINHIPIQILIRLKRYFKFNSTTHVLDLIIRQINTFEPAFNNPKIFREMDYIRAGGMRKEMAAINIDSPYKMRSMNIDLVIKTIAYLNALGFSQVKIIGQLKPENRIALDIVREKLAFEIVENGSVIDLVNLLRNTEVYIGPDSGPLHLANLLGSRCIGFYGPDSPDAFGITNRMSGSRIFYSDFGCSPCYQGYCHREGSSCMDFVCFDDIERALKEVAQQNRTG